jgi:hypothetical protein
MPVSFLTQATSQTRSAYLILSLMRLRRHVSLICLSLLAFALSANAQDVGKILDQYVKAAGGSKVLSRIQTLTLEGTVTACGDGNSGAFTLDTRLPNRYYSELILGPKHLIEAYNGKSAWHELAAGDPATMLGPEAIQLEAVSLVANSRLTDLKKNKLVATLIGHAQVRGKDALQIEIATASGGKRELFFDPLTHWLVKEAAPSGAEPQEILYDDYRPEGGVQVPRKLEIHRGADVFSIEITHVAVNGTVGERVFDFPPKSQVKLPDLKALFTEIDANQKAIDKIKEKYSGARVEEESNYDGKGKVTEHHLNEYSFFYLAGFEVSTLVKKEGKPLSDDEQKKENEKTRKQIEHIQKSVAEKLAKKEKAKEEGKQEKEDKDDVSIETFLHACQFVNPRRERFRGQDVLVFDFEPNPDFKPHKLAEKAIQKLAGVVWIDEKAHDVARLEAYFIGDLKIAGGMLANLQKGTSFAFEQEYVNNEVWLPTYEEAHVSVRVLLVKGFRVSSVTRYSDYKKFNVDTLSTIGAPKQP